jgi:hypothetical protein
MVIPVAVAPAAAAATPTAAAPWTMAAAPAVAPAAPAVAPAGSVGNELNGTADNGSPRSGLRHRGGAEEQSTGDHAGAHRTRCRLPD